MVQIITYMLSFYCIHSCRSLDSKTGGFILIIVVLGYHSDLSAPGHLHHQVE